MTIAERNDKLKHFIVCLKCEVSGKCCDNDCPTQYDAGNMGEIIENLEAISKALEQQPCDDAISRRAMHIELEKWIIYGEYKYSNATKYLHDRIVRLPPVTPQPKTGHWIDIMVGDMPAQACDRCNTFYPLAYTGGGHKYCPNCGAKMESEG